jgi:hypothetical protein
MNEVTVDVEETGAVRLDIDDVVVPDLVVEGARAGHRFSSSEMGRCRALAMMRRP